MSRSRNVNNSTSPNPHYSRALLLQAPMPDSSETGETGAVRRLKVGVRSSEHFSLQPSDRLARPAFPARRASIKPRFSRARSAILRRIVMNNAD